MSVSWNPWHGCRKLSEGCRHCYVYRQDAQHDKDSREVRRTAAFNLPVRRTRDGRYKVPPGEMVYTCFTSDFLVEEADAWRAEAWEMIRIRSDLRFSSSPSVSTASCRYCRPTGAGLRKPRRGLHGREPGDGRLPAAFAAGRPLRHKLVICAPLLGPLDIARYLIPGSKRYPSGANRATKPAPAITTGYFRSAANASRQRSPSFSTKPVHGLSRTGAFTASAARTSIRRPARPGSTTRQSDEVSPPSALQALRHPALVFPHPAPGPLHKAIPAPPSRPVRLRHAVTRSHISPAISLGNRPCPTPRPIPRNRFPRYHASQ